MKVPFSVYDFFGYLAAGAIVMFAWALTSTGFWILTGDIPVVVSVGLVLLGYLLGHTIAAISSWLFEQQVVRRVLGPSEEILMNERQMSGSLSSIFPTYGKPLPEDISNAVLAKARGEGISSGGRALFLHCLTAVRRDSATAERLSTFLNLYGFSRNASLACAISCFIFLLAALKQCHCCCASAGHHTMLQWSILACVLSAFLFFRYLKFYRHYTQEVFLSYHVETKAKD
jgi:hypothetical protein